MSRPSFESAALLSARFAIPRLRSDRVRRSRLVELLENSAGSRLVFIQAPAGFGKTTLLADWLAASRRPFAWIGIDREEHDADSFLTRLEAAVDYALGLTDPSPALPSLSAPAREGRLLRVAGRLADTGKALVLVIDDFHNLKNAEGQSLVARLCDFLPEGTTLVVASREGIPFPVGRLRARGELSEIGADALRFSLPEVREFLARVSPVRLCDEDAASLETRTEGWIAGLQLAVIALRDGREPRSFIASFGGNSRAVHDFLAEEALASLPPEDLDFLTALSVVECFGSRLSAALSAGLSPAAPGTPSSDLVEDGIEEARARLHRLERDCLFLVPLDDERNRYRFHVLFREALLGRLRDSDPGRERKLRLIASAWLEANGHPVEALRQALLAGDAERAGNLAEG
jgi:LuxR family transcriptional regulator, maltose regulon positive regulatory protein